MTAARERFHKSVVAISILGALYWLLTQAVVTFVRSRRFDGSAFDGPFQLLNPLRRIAAGGTGGVDFQFFHGLGLPYLHYPLFKLFGSDIFAAELSRYSLSLAAFVVPLVLVLYLSTRSWPTTVVIFATTASLSSITANLFLPGGSSLSVRSAAPLLICAALLSNLRSTRKSVVTGLLLGCSTLLGTEQAVAIFAAFVAVQALVALVTRSRAALVFGGLTAILGIVSAGVLRAAIGGWTGLRQSLRYELVSVAKDQFWYFGSPPNPFLGSWLDVLQDWPMLLKLSLGTLALVCAVAVLIKAQQTENLRAAQAIATLLLYSLLSCVSYLGIAHSKYFEPLLRALLVVTLLVLFHYGPLYLKRTEPGRDERQRTASDIFAFVFVMFGIHTTANYQAAAYLPISPSEYGDLAANPRLSGRWRMYLLDAESAVRPDPGLPVPVVWSTYTGMLESRWNVFHPSFDYIIHALGPENREAYIRKLYETRPAFIQTARKDAFMYEEWLQTTTWPFYQYIWENYEIAGLTEHSIFWKRRGNPSIGQPEIPLKLDDEEFTLTAPGSARAYAAVVTLTYRTQNRYGWIPVLGGSARYLMDVSGSLNTMAVSLPPYRQRIAFPVFLLPQGSATLRASSAGLLPAQLTLERAAVRYLPLDDTNALLAGELLSPEAQRRFRSRYRTMASR